MVFTLLLSKVHSTSSAMCNNLWPYCTCVHWRLHWTSTVSSESSLSACMLYRFKLTFWQKTTSVAQLVLRQNYFSCCQTGDIHKTPNCQILSRNDVMSDLKIPDDSIITNLEITFNPFPHIDAFWRLCSRRLFENIVTKEEIAQNMQKVENIVAEGEIARSVPFLLLSLCFQKAFCCRGVRKHLYEGKG